MDFERARVVLGAVGIAEARHQPIALNELAKDLGVEEGADLLRPAWARRSPRRSPPRP